MFLTILSGLECCCWLLKKKINSFVVFDNKSKLELTISIGDSNVLNNDCDKLFVSTETIDIIKSMLVETIARKYYSGFHIDLSALFCSQSIDLVIIIQK